MSTPFVLAPVPSVRRRRTRRNSRSTINIAASSRSRSNSTAILSPLSKSSDAMTPRTPSQRTRRKSVRRPGAHPEEAVSPVLYSSAATPGHTDTPSALINTGDSLQGTSLPSFPPEGKTGSSKKMLPSRTPSSDIQSHPPHPLDAKSLLRRIRSSLGTANKDDSDAQYSKSLSDQLVPPVPALPTNVPNKADQARKGKSKSKSKAKRNKTKTKKRSSHGAVPYATIIQLQMLMNGGSEEDWLAKRKSRKTRSKNRHDRIAMTYDTDQVSVAEVGGFKDEDGMIWWDEDEQYEWAALIPGDEDKDEDESGETYESLFDEWIEFDGLSSCYSPAGVLEGLTADGPGHNIDALWEELEDMTSFGAVVASPRPSPTSVFVAARRAKRQGRRFSKSVDWDIGNFSPISPRRPSASSFGARRAEKTKVTAPAPLLLLPRSPIKSPRGTSVVAVVTTPHHVSPKVAPSPFLQPPRPNHRRVHSETIVPSVVSPSRPFAVKPVGQSKHKVIDTTAVSPTYQVVLAELRRMKTCQRLNAGGAVPRLKVPKLGGLFVKTPKTKKIQRVGEEVIYS